MEQYFRATGKITASTLYWLGLYRGGEGLRGQPCAVLCCAVLCSAVLCCAVLCSAVQCCAVQCSAALRCAALRWTCAARACCVQLCHVGCVLGTGAAAMVMLPVVPQAPKCLLAPAACV